MLLFTTFCPLGGGKIKHYIYNLFHKVLYLYRKFGCKGTAFFWYLQIKNARVGIFYC